MTRADELLAKNSTVVEALLTEARARLVVVPLDSSLMEAAHLLHTGADLVVVCNPEGGFAGIVAKTDIVRRISQGDRSDSSTLTSLVVGQDVVLCRPGDKVAGVLSLMKQRKLKNVPVIDAENRPIGLLNSCDALQILLDQAEREEAALRDYVMGVGYQ